MTTKKNKKGKKVALSEFLGSEPKLVTVRGANWSEIVDKEEEDAKPIVVDIGALPTAPRAAHDVDYSTVPTNPPFVAHVANLSFQVDDEGLRRIFGDLLPKSARIMREGNRSRGVGLVEFETRDNLIEALKRTDKEVYGRNIRVNVSDKTDSHQNDGNRGGFGSRSHRPPGEERPDLGERWKRAEPRPDEPSDDRQGGGFNRDRQNRNDYSRQNMNRNPRDNADGNDFGFGYPRSRDDRGGHTGGSGGGGGGRDYNRQGQRNRYQDDDNRSNSGMDRPRYAGRYSDTRDVRERTKASDEPQDDQRETPRERPRLQLQPRTKPLESLQPLSGSSSSVNNVAANVTESSISNTDENSLDNTSNRRGDDSFSNENRDDSHQHESHETNQGATTSDDTSIPKTTRGAGASIFGGAKPVDTLAKELEIEKKLQELQLANKESHDETEEKPAPARQSYTRTGDRDNFRGKRSSHNDDYHNRDRERDRRDEGRSSHGSDYHHKREFSGGRQYEDEGRRRNDDDQYRRGGGGGGADRYGGPARRDNDSVRPSKYNHPDRDSERGNFRPRDRDRTDRDDREQDNTDFASHVRSSNTNVNPEPAARVVLRGKGRRVIAEEDTSSRLQLSNKFGALDDDDLDGGDDENEDAQSPNVDK